jgi:hypothetical protein
MLLARFLKGLRVYQTWSELLLYHRGKCDRWRHETQLNSLEKPKRTITGSFRTLNQTCCACYAIVAHYASFVCSVDVMTFGLSECSLNISCTLSKMLHVAFCFEAR